VDLPISVLRDVVFKASAAVAPSSSTVRTTSSIPFTQQKKIVSVLSSCSNYQNKRIQNHSTTFPQHCLLLTTICLAEFLRLPSQKYFFFFIFIFFQRINKERKLSSSKLLL
jgi:hypothetical protein